MLWCILSHENILLLTLFTQIAHAHGTLQLLESKSRKVGISIYFCATSTWGLFPEVNAVISVLGTFPEIFHTYVISLDLHSGLLARGCMVNPVWKTGECMHSMLVTAAIPIEACVSPKPIQLLL